MKTNELCQQLHVSEKQFLKICQRLGIAISEEQDRAFTPREVQRLQYFVNKKRAAAKNKETRKPAAATATIAGTGRNTLITEVVASRSHSEQEPDQTEPVTASPETVPAATPAPTSTAVAAPSAETASTGLRALAYIIDCLCTLILAPLVIVPVIGQILVGLLLVCYWLLRDVAGASPGKLILKMQVVNNSGDQSQVAPRILRNLPFAIAPLLFCIPFVGILMGVPVAIVMVLLEATMLLVTGNRVGDLLGGTSVKNVPQVSLAADSSV